MDIKEQRLPATRTARYYTAGPAGPVRRLWLVLHGYGQLAGAFIEKCGPLAGEGQRVVAPEGLNRFYLKGYFGKVGAAWMTREARKDDILDNVRFLDDVLATVSEKYGAFERLAVLGYSQGGPTAARWAAVTRHRVDDLVMFCSDFPRDIADASLEKLKNLRLWYVHASDDEFMDEALFRQQTDYLDDRGFRYTEVPFEGRHELREAVLERLSGLLSRADG